MVQSFPHAPDVFALLKELAVITGHVSAPVLRQGHTLETALSSRSSTAFSAPQVVPQDLTSNRSEDLWVAIQPGACKQCLHIQRIRLRD